MPPEVQQTVSQIPSWFVGALVIAITTLSGVVVYLFKLVLSQRDNHDKNRQSAELLHAEERNKWLEEKAAWDAEREAEHASLALNYETKAKELAEGYNKALSEERAAHLTREELIRKEGAELVERMSAEAAKAAGKMADLLQKFHERFVGGPRRRGG